MNSYYRFLGLFGYFPCLQSPDKKNLRYIVISLNLCATSVQEDTSKPT